MAGPGCQRPCRAAAACARRAQREPHLPRLHSLSAGPHPDAAWRAPQAFESRSMRGMKRLAADPMYPATGHTIAKPGPDPAKVASANGAPANGMGPAV
jgi:hypothetical protein